MLYLYCIDFEPIETEIVCIGLTGIGWGDVSGWGRTGLRGAKERFLPGIWVQK